LWVDVFGSGKPPKSDALERAAAPAAVPKAVNLFRASASSMLVLQPRALQGRSLPFEACSLGCTCFRFTGPPTARFGRWNCAKSRGQTGSQEAGR